MNMLRRVLLALRGRLLWPLLVLVFQQTALAGISAPNSSYTFSADGRRVLILRSPYPADDQTPEMTFPGGQVVLIRELFEKSGVYDAATLAPLWQFDWFDFPYDLRFSADFSHMARLNRFGMRSDWAIRFYDEGKLVKSYDCSFLLTRLRHPVFLPLSTWDWYSRWFEDFDLDATGDRVQLATARRQIYIHGHKLNLGVQEFYEFDLASGALRSSRTVGLWVPWAWCAALVALFVGALLMLWQLYRLWRRIWLLRTHRRRGFPVS